MRKLLFLFVLFAAPAFAQNPTSVTGTITDPNGVAWYPSTVKATLTPATAINPTVNGHPINPNSDSLMSVVSQTNPDGSFSMSLFPNAAISPGGTQWVFFVYTNGSGQPAGLGPKNFTVAITIAGASQDVGATLRAAAPVLLGAGGGGAGTPGGTSGQIQYNNTGAFGGFGSFNSGTSLVSVPGALATTPVGSFGGYFSSPEGTVGDGTNGANPALGLDICYADTTQHKYLCSFNNSAFSAIGGGGAVSSVFSRTGAVVATANDYTLSQIGLSPLTTTQDILYDNAGSLARLPIVTSGTCLGNTGGVWASLTCSGGSGVVLVPATTATNEIQPTANSVVGLTVVGTTGTGSPDVADFCSTSACTTGSSTKISSAGSLSTQVMTSQGNIFLDAATTGNRAFYLSALGDRIATASNANGDLAGTLAISAATSQSFTFPTAYTNVPSCVVSLIEATAGTIPATGAWSYIATTAAIRVDVTNSGTWNFSYHCIALGN